MECDSKDCNNDATKRIVFYVLAKTGNSPCIAKPELFACDGCATEKEAENLLVDNIPGRRQIEDTFEKQKLARPDWTRSYAKWEKI